MMCPLLTKDVLNPLLEISMLRPRSVAVLSRVSVASVSTRPAVTPEDALKASVPPLTVHGEMHRIVVLAAGKLKVPDSVRPSSMRNVVLGALTAASPLIVTFRRYDVCDPPG